MQASPKTLQIKLYELLILAKSCLYITEGVAETTLGNIAKILCIPKFSSDGTILISPSIVKLFANRITQSDDYINHSGYCLFT
jgi:hypothetical protein